MGNRIVVLFNLKPGMSAADYEAWAQKVDLPTVGALPSVEGFAVFKSLSVLGAGERSPPYAYIEIIDVNDMRVFGDDIATAAVRRVAEEFHAVADDPIFILTEKLA